MITEPKGGICLMGGASEDDEAMRWFLEKANGGDILVLRSSGSDGYNEYFYSELGVPVNSVETIVFNQAAAANDPYIYQKIAQAEAIWFAGGDQWKYISYWRNTPIDEFINIAVKDRNIAIGGTSAGMAIMGQFYFSAANGTIRSEEALADPYDQRITVDSTTFLQNENLENTITDTHFDDPDRKGRLVTFIARILADYRTNVRAIACEEYTAVCIEPDGIARVFGGFPEEQDFAYFVQINCVQSDNRPETILSGEPLHWEQGGAALKVYQIPGTATGTNTFDLKDWITGNGGSWWNWQVKSGTLEERQGGELNCDPLSTDGFGKEMNIQLTPNPTSGELVVGDLQPGLELTDLNIIDVLGRQQPLKATKRTPTEFLIDMSGYENGLYTLHIAQDQQVNSVKILKK
ncbi:MAG: T9SS type A sorting domain-containing protein [Cytophagales bacterium]|nr:T9SS type A sorting domain-containing protein [Cytophagales bacterium]